MVICGAKNAGFIQYRKVLGGFINDYFRLPGQAITILKSAIMEKV